MVDVHAADTVVSELLELLVRYAPLSSDDDVLVVGLAESSLLPAWWLAYRLATERDAGSSVKLALSTRAHPPAGVTVMGHAGSSPSASPTPLFRDAPNESEHRSSPVPFDGGESRPVSLQAGDNLPESVCSNAPNSTSAHSSPTLCWVAFREPHSHAPCHYMVIPRAASRVIVVEDEITTGQTLTNLLRTLLDTLRPHRIDVLSMLDLRSRHDADSMDLNLRSADCVVAVHALAGAEVLSDGAVARLAQYHRSLGVALPRPPRELLVGGSSQGPSSDELRAALAAAGAHYVVAVGECIDAPLRLAAELLS